MAKGQLIRVDRGDGHRFRINENQFDAFKRRNPGAFVLGKPKPAAVVELEPEEEEAAALDPELMALTLSKLIQMAEQRGVDVPNGPKAVVVRRLMDDAEARAGDDDEGDGSADPDDEEGEPEA